MDELKEFLVNQISMADAEALDEIFRNEYAIGNSKDLKEYIRLAYNHYGTELNASYFDIYVIMKERDIITAYAELQNELNGDECVRIEKGYFCDSLIPEGEFEQEYKGNCEDFLLSLNSDKRFCRFCDDEKLSFVF